MDERYRGKEEEIEARAAMMQKNLDEREEMLRAQAAALEDKEREGGMTSRQEKQLEQEKERLEEDIEQLEEDQKVLEDAGFIREDSAYDSRDEWVSEGVTLFGGGGRRGVSYLI